MSKNQKRVSSKRGDTKRVKGDDPTVTIPIRIPASEKKKLVEIAASISMDIYNSLPAVVRNQRKKSTEFFTVADLLRDCVTKGIKSYGRKKAYRHKAG